MTKLMSALAAAVIAMNLIQPDAADAQCVELKPFLSSHSCTLRGFAANGNGSISPIDGSKELFIFLTTGFNAKSQAYSVNQIKIPDCSVVDKTPSNGFGNFVRGGTCRVAAFRDITGLALID